jgi:hypothetical protein
VDWLAACISLRVFGAVLVVFLRRWRKIAQSTSQWEARADTRRNVLNYADQLKAKYTPVTLLSQCKLAVTARNTFLAFKIIRAPKKIFLTGRSYLCQELTITSSKAKSMS